MRREALILGSLFLIAVITTFLTGRSIFDAMEKSWNEVVLQTNPSIATDSGVLSEQTKVSPVPGDSVGSSSATLEIDSAYGKEYKVTRVVDGDTFEFSDNGQLFMLRIIGIDTPETVDPRRGVQCFGKEASNEAKRILLGKTIYLKKDVSEVDKYKRLLRYVYLKLDDGNLLFVNDYLVREGFAQAYTYPPDIAMNEQLLEAQREAQAAKKGLWGVCS